MARILDVNIAQSNDYIELRNKDKVLRATLFSASPPLIFDMEGYAEFTITASNTTSTNVLSVNASNDGIYFGPVRLNSVNGSLYQSSSSFYISNNIPSNTFKGGKSARYVRVGVINTVSVPTIVTVVLHKTASLNIETLDPRISSEYAWSYVSASGGITTTTPVTLVAAPSPSFVQAIGALDITNTGTADVEVSIRTITTATVIWRRLLKAGTGIERVFSPMKMGLGGQGLEVVLSTGTNVAVYINAEGLTISRFL